MVCSLCVVRCCLWAVVCVVCSLMFGVVSVDRCRCSLSIVVSNVCCSWFVVCCVLVGVRRSLFVVRCLSFVAFCFFVAVC